MPRFSVIVTAQGLAGRLPTALDSVLTQSFTDFELITACETPDSPAATVTGEYAARDPRVTHPTGSRAAGMHAATGTYLLFMDATDVLTPGALATMDARLQETGDVDVLYLAHGRVPGCRRRPHGRTATGLGDGLPKGVPRRSPTRLPGRALRGHRLVRPGDPRGRDDGRAGHGLRTTS